jgi:hypothetical protein
VPDPPHFTLIFSSCFDNPALQLTSSHKLFVV